MTELKRYDLETLRRVEATGLFRDDMAQFMKLHDYPTEIIGIFRTSDAIRKCDLLGFYQDHVNDEEVIKYLHRYIDDLIFSWVSSSKAQLNYLYNELEKVNRRDDVQRITELVRTIDMHLNTIAKYTGYHPMELDID